MPLFACKTFSVQMLVKIPMKRSTICSTLLAANIAAEQGVIVPAITIARSTFARF